MQVEYVTRIRFTSRRSSQQQRNFTVSNRLLRQIIINDQSRTTGITEELSNCPTQDLVLPRMRGTATASFFLATTLVGLGLGPFMVGAISDLSGSLRIGMLSLIGVAPISLALLIYAYRVLPKAEATIAERAEAAIQA